MDIIDICVSVVVGIPTLHSEHIYYQERLLTVDVKKAKGKQSACWTGYEEISGDYWHAHVIRSANGTKGRKELDCNITKEYM